MTRLYENSRIRQKQILNGWWDFKIDPKDIGEKMGYFNRFAQPSRKVWVPHVWNSLREYASYNGVSWYRRGFILHRDSSIRITFEGILLSAKVWLDGKYLGECNEGFISFSFTVKNLKVGEHELTVRISARYDKDSLPKAGVDWYPYGGLFRDVSIEYIDGIYIENLKVMPRISGKVKIEAVINNLNATRAEKTIELWINNDKIRSGRFKLNGLDKTRLCFDIKIKKPRRWDLHAPYLYEARLTLDKDDYLTRFGIREITVSGKKIFLNGKKIFLKGVNRHEDHPDWGFAMPPELIRRDIEIIKNMGLNTVRGAHYPNNELVLDLCDEMGLLFMEEIPAWQYSLRQLSKKAIKSRMFGMLKAMIARDFNHPCVYAWSVTNESATNDRRARKVIAELLDFARSADQTRLAVFVSGWGLSDRCYDLADMVCINQYYGWYIEEEKSFAKFKVFLEKMKAKYPDKPLVMTEFGAEAIPGYRSLNTNKWSEEYQAELIKTHVNIIQSDPDLSGFYIWQFCDQKTTPLGALTRPRGYNNKGILDQYRNPKLSYYTLREIVKNG